MKGVYEELAEAMEPEPAQSGWSKALDAMEDDDPMTGVASLKAAGHRAPTAQPWPSEDAKPLRWPHRASSLGRREPLAKVGRADPRTSLADMRAFNALVNEQERSLAHILGELRQHGRKRNHWIWYVFPTDKEGFSDFAGTRVTKTTAQMLCNHEPTGRLWRKVLETICDLIEEKGHRYTLPSIDHGRVFFFIRFWQSLQESPGWMKAVCERLDQYSWHCY